MTEHMNIKRKVQKINKKSTFNSILDESMLDEREKQLMTMHYLEGNSFDYIADIMGYSINGILKMHKRSLKKLEELL